MVISPEIWSLACLCVGVRIITAQKSSFPSPALGLVYALDVYRCVEKKKSHCVLCVCVSGEQSQIPIMPPLSSVDAQHCRSLSLGI